MLNWRVKIRFNPLLSPLLQKPSHSVLSSPLTPSLFSLFLQKRICASPSFPNTSLFQNEYSRQSQQSKSFIHSFAKHPTGTPFISDLHRRRITIPFRITFFADPLQLTTVESYSYRKHRGGGARRSARRSLNSTRKRRRNPSRITRLRTFIRAFSARASHPPNVPTFRCLFPLKPLPQMAHPYPCTRKLHARKARRPGNPGNSPCAAS